MTRGWLPQRAGSLGLNGGRAAAAVPTATTVDDITKNLHLKQVIILFKFHLICTDDNIWSLLQCSTKVQPYKPVGQWTGFISSRDIPYSYGSRSIAMNKSMDGWSVSQQLVSQQHSCIMVKWLNIFGFTCELQVAVSTTIYHVYMDNNKYDSYYCKSYSMYTYTIKQVYNKK